MFSTFLESSQQVSAVLLVLRSSTDSLRDVCWGGSAASSSVTVCRGCFCDYSGLVLKIPSSEGGLEKQTRVGLLWTYSWTLVEMISPEVTQSGLKGLLEGLGAQVPMRA